MGGKFFAHMPYFIKEAEAGGFEPPDRFPGQHISSVLLSTAQPRLRLPDEDNH